MVKVTIDGRTLGAAEGTTILRAAKDAGIDIPHFCSHPAFPPEGSCRLCFVEIEGFPKLELACSTPVREGLKVETRSPRVVEARRGVLEYFLADHPIDCPICDKAGECRLQDYYQEYGLFESAFREGKERREKKIPIGEHLILDRERCVLCTRCVRFLRDVTKTRELGVFERGVRAEIGIWDGRPVANLYAGNLVDICPVGAITDAEFRFKTRTWFLSARAAICPLCSRGCAIEIDFHPGFARVSGSAKVYRVRPRFNPEVNGHWICDRGRYGYPAMHRDRFDRPVWNREGKKVELTREKLASILAVKIEELFARGRADRLGLVLHSSLTQEDLAAVRTAFLSRNPGPRIWFADPPEGRDDGFLLTAARTANRRGASESGFRLDPVDLRELGGGGLDLLLVFGPGLAEAGAPEDVRGALAGIGTKALIASGPSDFEASFDFVVPAALPSEKSGTFVNVDGLRQAFVPALVPCGDVVGEGDFIASLGRLIASVP
jgi:NADH-quinone oxidoreductase subunit G